MTSYVYLYGGCAPQRFNHIKSDPHSLWVKLQVRLLKAQFEGLCMK